MTMTLFTGENLRKALLPYSKESLAQAEEILAETETSIKQLKEYLFLHILEGGVEVLHGSILDLTLVFILSSISKETEQYTTGFEEGEIEDCKQTTWPKNLFDYFLVEVENENNVFYTYQSKDRELIIFKLNNVPRQLRNKRFYWFYNQFINGNIIELKEDIDTT
jgi:hypothetical protein